jgi:hypothetical protein
MKVPVKSGTCIRQKKFEKKPSTLLFLYTIHSNPGEEEPEDPHPGEQFILRYLMRLRVLMMINSQSMDSQSMGLMILLVHFKRFFFNKFNYRKLSNVCVWQRCDGNDISVCIER